MFAPLASFLGLFHSRSSAHSATFVILLTLAPTGCTEVAGLHEHELYKGFPDSKSVPCWEGPLKVSCDKVLLAKPQDGQVSMMPPGFARSGDDVVDHVTGLSWYRIQGDPQMYQEAYAYCDVLPGDYRLPTLIELVSLLDFRDGSSVRIDPEMFPNVKADRYWTGTPYAINTSDYWTVDFCSSCPSPYLLSSDYPGNKAGVLCVKSEGEGFVPGPFTITGPENRFVYDERTKLMWFKEARATKVNWPGSLQYCAKAPDGSFNDFRMPNIKELATIIDATKATDSIQAPFEFMGNQTFWSSTPTTIPGQIFVLSSQGGSITHQSFSESYFSTLCVRGPD